MPRRIYECEPLICQRCGEALHIVAAITAAIARIKGMGAPLSIPEPYEPGRRTYAFDPDGHELELVEYAA